MIERAIDTTKLIIVTFIHLIKSDQDMMKVISASFCAQIINFAWLRKYADTFDDLGVVFGVGIQILTLIYLVFKVSNEMNKRKRGKQDEK